MKSTTAIKCILAAIGLALVIGSSDGWSSDIATGTISGSVSARGIRDARNVIVYVEKVDGVFKPDSTHPVLDQIDRVFVPHVMPILAGTTVRIANSDSLDHNIFSPSKTNPFNIGTWGYGGERDITFEKTGVISLLCNIHHEMSAFILVLQNPFFSQTGPDGVYTIEGVPVGKYTLMTWHEKLNEKAKVIEVKAGDTVTVDFRLSP